MAAVTAFGLSLRARLFAALLAIALTATAGFAIAMNAFVHVLEDELLNQTLRRELDTLAQDYRRNHDAAIAGKRGRSGTVFVVPPGASDAPLPEAIARLDAGERREIHIDGREYDAASRDVDGARLYLMIATRSVEHLEDRLGAIGWLTLGGAILASLLIAVVFSGLILRPVRRLARRLTGFDPGQVSAPIADEYGDRTMREIARSFDEMTARFHAFVDRERSFTEDASHELRTPLAIALSANELLLEQTDLSPQSRERAERVREAGIRMQRLIEALLFLARSHSNDTGSCDVAAVLAEVLPAHRSEMERKGLAVVVATQPAPVAAPAGIVDCVLHNLLENAVAHTDSGEIGVCVDSDRLVLTDTGDGIAADALEHIFDRRYRSADSRGYGIGLHLVQRICVRLGWRVAVANRQPHGSRFQITFSPEQGAVT